MASNLPESCHFSQVMSNKERGYLCLAPCPLKLDIITKKWYSETVFNREKTMGLSPLSNIYD